MSLTDGHLPRPEKRRAGRELLTLREPAHEDLLRSLPSDLNLDVARLACKRLWAWRNSFDILRRRRGGLLATPRRFDKSDADRALRAALAAMAEGGAR